MMMVMRAYFEPTQTQQLHKIDLNLCKKLRTLPLSIMPLIDDEIISEFRFKLKMKLSESKKKLC